MKKRILPLALAIALALSLAACGDDSPYSSAVVGDVIQFGGYDWRVLDIQDGKALIISKDILSTRAYHSVNTEITWEDSDIRQYLNGEFYNGFSAEEKGWIVETSLLTGGYSEDSKSSIDTTDNNIPVGQQ